MVRVPLIFCEEVWGAWLSSVAVIGNGAVDGQTEMWVRVPSLGCYTEHLLSMLQLEDLF